MRTKDSRVPSPPAATPPPAEPPAGRAHAAGPVSPRLGRAAIVIGCLFVLLIAALIRHEWTMYADADDAITSLDVFRATLVAMDKASAERGPMNAALGADEQMPNGPPASLQAARSATDAAIAALERRLAARSCGWCEPEQLTLQHITADLAGARAEVDKLLRLPRDERTNVALDNAIGQMVLVVRQFRPIIDASELATVDRTSGALDALQMARFAATLRDEAGLLGSRFTSALTAERPLTHDEQLNVERSYGRVQQLRFGIESLAATNPALTRGAFSQVNQKYFTRGIDYVQTVRALPGGSDAPLPGTGEFAAKYVPMMQPIIDFRDEMLARAQTTLERQRDAMFMRAVLASVSGLVLASLLFVLLWLFRRYVITPFNDATRAIIAIARGDLSATTPSHRYDHGEIQSLFDAVEVLRARSRDRLQLELERDTLIGQLKTMAETDALTGLLNRRAFENRARVLKTVARNADADADAGESFVTLILFDLDHFKRINDTYGHPTGDEALKTIGNLSRDTWRQDDIVARTGGEEFAVLLETPAYAEALQTVERFRDKMRKITLHGPNGEPFTMTASFGVVVSRRDAMPAIESMIIRADALLYRAKTEGRNRVVAETPDTA